MRTYTNKAGESIEVTQEHINTSIEIKKQLQNASPSRKCSWNLHKKMMEKEGFFDSDTNESYRCLIKDEQKKLGQLPEVKKYAEMVTDGKLNSIKELVGEISFEKRENQLVLRELNKTKREVIDYVLVTEQIESAFKNFDWNQFEIKIKGQDERKSNTNSGKRMIVTLTDLHIGALVDTDINTYNYEVAKQRMTKFAEKVIAKAQYNNVSQIDIVNCGDVVEHSNMRYGQSYNSEFTYSEQLVRASDIIIKFIKSIASHGFNITYSGFAGNHDRVNDKDKNIDGDHAQRPINQAIQIFIENSDDMKNVTYVQAKDYSHRLIDVNGRNFKFVHGDLDSFKDENLVAKHSSMDEVEYDAIIMGHFHHYRDIEVGMGKHIIMFGSLKGADEYSEKLRKLSHASQGLIVIDSDGEFESKRINLQ